MISLREKFLEWRFRRKNCFFLSRTHIVRNIVIVLDTQHDAPRKTSLFSCLSSLLSLSLSLSLFDLFLSFSIGILFLSLFASSNQCTHVRLFIGSLFSLVRASERSPTFTQLLKWRQNGNEISLSYSLLLRINSDKPTSPIENRFTRECLDSTKQFCSLLQYPTSYCIALSLRLIHVEEWSLSCLDFFCSCHQPFSTKWIGKVWTDRSGLDSREQCRYYARSCPFHRVCYYWQAEPLTTCQMESMKRERKSNLTREIDVNYLFLA